jgi:L-fucose isomerase-like protein
LENISSVELGIIAVSRNCFPIELSKKRRENLVAACKAKSIKIVEIEKIIENESDIAPALKEIADKKINALVVFLGNFGPEAPETILIQKFKKPTMLIAAAEETGNNLIGGRGDAYCGMLNASYNSGLRKLRPYIPEYPVGTADELAEMALEFLPIARTLLSLASLKVIAFGPRPEDFFACNAPIKPLFDLNIEVMENSELDLLELFNSMEGAPEVENIAREMSGELGKGNKYPDIVTRLAQYEATLLKFMEDNLGSRQYAVFANKCWPAFEKTFKFVPCYINSRLAARGIPVACEVDIYGAVSEYIATSVSMQPATILDINNTVPHDLMAGHPDSGYKNSDLFMGFHCGNTAACHLVNPEMNYQLIMHRLMEPDKAPDITRGTLEGQIRPGEITLFRLQGTAGCELKSYIAEGEVLPVPPKSFGGIGIFGIREMGRFYRHVLIEKRFPHHTAVAFNHAGKSLFAVMRLLGIPDISYNLPSSVKYPNENPF